MSLDTPSLAATAVFDPPSAHVNTIRERNANACAVFRHRAYHSNVRRSVSVSSSGTRFGHGNHTIVRRQTVNSQH
ncbi:hypothetical protein MOQ72_44120, partial [Saccharopolyspora sp. K220]|uniref:hypothetical protein n=1 Tax=Saccharopolyspora soli TaxID=2926618 RepID=UPI001F5651FE